MLCVFNVMVSTLGAALVSEILGISRDVVISGFSMSSSAPRKKVRMSWSCDLWPRSVYYQAVLKNVETESFSQVTRLKFLAQIDLWTSVSLQGSWVHSNFCSVRKSVNPHSAEFLATACLQGAILEPFPIALLLLHVQSLLLCDIFAILKPRTKQNTKSVNSFTWLLISWQTSVFSHIL